MRDHPRGGDQRRHEVEKCILHQHHLFERREIISNNRFIARDGGGPLRQSCPHGSWRVFTSGYCFRHAAFLLRLRAGTRRSVGGETSQPTPCFVAALCSHEQTNPFF